MNNDSLDAAWAVNVLEDSLRRMKLECRAAQRNDIWEVFKARTLTALLERDKPLPYESLVEQYGLSTPRQASNLLTTGRRMFTRILHTVVGEYASDGEIEAELGELQTAVEGAAGSRQIAGRVFLRNFTLRADDAHRLAALFSLDVHGASLWQADELGAIFRHQLAAPLELNLYLAEDDSAGPRADNLSSLALSYRNLGELLADGQPPLPLLVRLKDYARTSSADPDSPLPEQLPAMLYWAAIAVALVSRRTCISGLGTQGLQRGLEWAVEQHWISEDLRRVFRKAQLPAV